MIKHINFKKMVLAFGAVIGMSTAQAAPVTTNVDFTGTITSSALLNNFGVRQNWFTGNVSGHWSFTKNDAGDITDIYASNNQFGARDYNLANANDCRDVSVSDIAISDWNFHGSASESLACGRFLHIDRLDLDLNAGTGYLDEYFQQPGATQFYYIYFNLLTVNGSAVPFPALVPEPGSLALVLLAMLMLGATSRRLRKN